MVLFGFFGLSEKQRQARVAQSNNRDPCFNCSYDSFDVTKWSTCSFDVTAFFRTDEEIDYEKVEFMNESDNTLDTDRFFPTPPGTASEPVIHIDFDPHVICKKSTNLLDKGINADADADVDVVGVGQRLDKGSDNQILKSPLPPRSLLAAKSSKSSQSSQSSQFPPLSHLEQQDPTPIQFPKRGIDLNLNRGLKKLIHPNPDTEYIEVRYNRARIERCLDHLCPPTDKIPRYRRRTIASSTNRPATNKISNTTNSKMLSKMEEESSTISHLDLPYSTNIPIDRKKGPLPVATTILEPNVDIHKESDHPQNDTSPKSIAPLAASQKTPSAEDNQPFLYASSTITTNEANEQQTPTLARISSRSTTDLVELASLRKKTDSEPKSTATTAPNSSIDENQTFLITQEAFSVETSNSKMADKNDDDVSDASFPDIVQPTCMSEVSSSSDPRKARLNAADKQRWRSIRSLGDDISEGRGKDKSDEFEDQSKHGQLCFFDSEDRIEYMKNPHLFRQAHDGKPSYIETRLEIDQTKNRNHNQENNEKEGGGVQDLFVTAETGNISDTENITLANNISEDDQYDESLPYKSSKSTALEDKPSQTNHITDTDIDQDLSYASLNFAKAVTNGHSEKKDDHNISFAPSKIGEVVEGEPSHLAHRKDDDLLLSYGTENLTLTIHNVHAGNDDDDNVSYGPSKIATASDQLNPVNHPLHSNEKSDPLPTLNLVLEKQPYHSDHDPDSGHDSFTMLPQTSSLTTHTLRINSSSDSSSYSSDNPNIVKLRNRLHQIRSRIKGNISDIRVRDDSLFKPSMSSIRDEKTDDCNNMRVEAPLSPIPDANNDEIRVKSSLSSIHDVKKDDIGVKSSWSSLSSSNDVKKNDCNGIGKEWEGSAESYQNIPNLMDGVRSEDDVISQEPTKLAMKPGKPSSPTGVEEFEPSVESSFFKAEVAGMGENGGTKLLQEVERSDSLSTMALLSASTLTPLKQGEKVFDASSIIEENSRTGSIGEGNECIRRLKARLRQIEDNVKVSKKCKSICTI